MRNRKTKKPGRRRFLARMVGAALALGLPSVARAFWVRQLGVRTVEKKNFSFDPENGLVKFRGKEPEPYALKVDGLVGQPFTLSYREMLSLPARDQVSDFHCVEGWSVPDVPWRGFSFGELAKRAKPLPEAKYVVFHSLGQTGVRPKGQGHYIESFPLDRLLDPKQEIILAHGLMGKPLPLDHGAPLRVIAPRDLAYKSIKFVQRVEFAASPRPGWWTLANPIYPIDAPVPAGRLKGKPGRAAS